ncbi:MAG TPA: hypothetical protein VK832_11210 [Burkholderiaceae bacterium]|nr:hypothetical protein [Burkholderiaceae bacterium]
MNRSQVSRRGWVFGMMTGFALMNVALFAHPMSPEDFLGLAFSDPLQSIADAQGGAMAIFFWISSALALSGLVGLLASNRLALHWLDYKPVLSPRAH